MKSLPQELYGDLSAWGRVWLYLGLASLAAATAMSVGFGWDVSWKHAVFLGLLSIVAAFIPDAAYSQWHDGRRIVGGILAVIALPLFAIEYSSHAGYTAGLRGSNISEARVQNTKWTDGRDEVTDHKANLKMWQAQLDKLNAENGWAATTKADGLRKELATITDRIEQEKAGTRGRKAGCGRECERLQNEANDLSKRIGTVEQVADLTERIAATMNKLSAAREGSAKTEHKDSAVDHQNKFFKKAVAVFAFGSDKAPGIVDEKIEQTVNLGMALAGTGVPALCLFVAGLYRVRRDDDAPPVRRTEPTEKSAPNGRSMIIERLVDDTTFADMLARLPERRATA